MSPLYCDEFVQIIFKIKLKRSDLKLLSHHGPRVEAPGGGKMSPHMYPFASKGGRQPG